MSILVLLLLLASPAEEKKSEALDRLARSLLFHAPFDESPDALRARESGKIHTSASGKALEGQPGLSASHVAHEKEGGRFGGHLHFKKKDRPLVYFPGGQNVGHREKGFSGSVSIWMSLDPGKDLEPGYVDPIQITDKKWNDSAFFLDFTDKNPRQFRLGVFADSKVWNPEGKEWDDIAVEDRPMVVVKDPPFRRDRWTHVVYTFENFNDDSDRARASLYVDGKLAGTLEGRPQKFTWNPAKATIQLGINYVGKLDEVSIFDRALTAREVELLHRLPGGIRDLPDPEKKKKPITPRF